MARTNNLTNFLNDVSSAIKQKTGDSTPIPASEFDTEILSIETAGTYQTKSVTITENTTTTITPDTGYDAIEQLTVTTNVPMSQLQSKSVTITSNGNIAVLPDTNYDGMTQVNLNVNVPSGSGGIQEFSSEQAMKEAGLEEGDKAVVYNSTDKLVGYYEADVGTMIKMVPVTTIQYQNNNYTVDVSSSIKSINLEQLVALCNEITLTYNWVAGESVYKCLVYHYNNKFYVGVLLLDDTNVSSWDTISISGDNYITNNIATRYTTSHFKYCEIDLDNFTYGEEIDTSLNYNTYSFGGRNYNFPIGPNTDVIPVIYDSSDTAFLGGVDILTPMSSAVSRYTIIDETLLTVDELQYNKLDTGLIYGTQDADATANDISKDKIAYSQGNKLIGTLNGTKLFETQAEMQADPTAQEGDLAVVYRNEMTIPSPGDTISSFSLPDTVRFGTAITNSSTLMLRSGMLMLRCTLNATSYVMVDQMGTVMHDRIQYTSSDGIIYTRTDSGAKSYDLGTEVTIPSNANGNILKFLSVNETVFEGLYQYNTNQYAIAKSQLDTTSDYVYGKTFYGENGVEEGTLQQTTNLTKEQIRQRAEIYNKISNLSPIETDMQYYFNNCSSLTTIPQLNTGNVTNMHGMFYGCTSLIIIPLLDTNNVTDMNVMFNNCTSLTTIPQLDTSNVTDMTSMFSGCSNLTTIPLLNTSNATKMHYMFSDCTSLTEIPLLDTSNITNMEDMFEGCTSLTTIPLLDTSNVTNMNYMFRNCTSLTTIPSLNTSNVGGMAYMFYGCTNLTTIPLLDTSNVTNMGDTFNGCTSLSNESLNNILAMCTNATKITSADKKLKSIGLTETQANTCKTLSNYSAFTAAGWTTGY